MVLRRAADSQFNPVQLFLKPSSPLLPCSLIAFQKWWIAD
jgi:hypothetical protein